jgi:nucleoside 2-deoxyribosyltransferase
MPDGQGRPIAYLAGPDVFYPGALSRAAEMKQTLAARGMAGLFPLDNQFDPSDYSKPKHLGLAIGRANEILMRDADICIANIQPWRGPEADDGTAYEIGFMAALGKLIVLYTNDSRTFAERVVDDTYRGDVYRDGSVIRGRSDDMMVEDFDGFADNLMLINAAVNAVECASGEGADPATVVQYSFAGAADFAKSLWDSQKARRKGMPGREPSGP